jgi:hypothetical protein
MYRPQGQVQLRLMLGLGFAMWQVLVQFNPTKSLGQDILRPTP